MGRRNCLPFDRDSGVKLRLERLRWVSQDYDSKGAYWGRRNGDYIYCGWNDYNEVRIFVRALHHRDAKEQVKRILPNARFYR